jgi:glutamate carboxypeptidase
MKDFTGDPRVSGAAGFLEKNFQRYMKIFEKMVGINSYTLNSEGVNRLGAYTAGFFEDLGFTGRMIQSSDRNCGRHVILSRNESAPRRIGIVSHLDTVFTPEEEAAHKFFWRVEGSRVYGPGTNDIKGGTITALMALEALAHICPELFESAGFEVLLDATEETDSEDFGKLCSERLAEKGTAALIYEAGERKGDAWTLVTSRKGRALFAIKASGRAAHAGSAHADGINAVTALAEVLLRASSITDYPAELTVNIGSIIGGGPVNRVPHEARCAGEMRAFTPAVLDEGVRRLETLGSREQGSYSGRLRADIEIDIERINRPWPVNPGTERLFSIFKESASDIGMPLTSEARGGLSDGNYIWDIVPCIDGLGPTGGNCHCSEKSDDGSRQQEYTDIDSIIPKALLSFSAMIKIIESSIA